MADLEPEVHGDEEEQETIPERFGFRDATMVRDHLAAELYERGLDIDNVRGMVILGSGLNGFARDYMRADHANEVSGPLKVSFEHVYAMLQASSPYSGDIPKLRGKVKGHARSIVIGPLDGDTSGDLYMAQQGREHPYEGISAKRATFWMRVAQLMGVNVLIGSNGAGIVTPGIVKGDKLTLEEDDLMLVDSDRDFGDDSPLKGENDARFGPRFPHKGDEYPEGTRKLIAKVARDLGIRLPEGTYIRMPGPTYESKPDVYWLRSVLEGMWEQGRVAGDPIFLNRPLPIGVVGMSSTFENVVALQAAQSPKFPAFRHRAYISAATNYAALLGPRGWEPKGPLEHSHVDEAGKRVADKFGKLVQASLMELKKAA